MIDTHCHLDFKDFDSNRDEVLTEARDAGIHTIVNIGADLASSIRGVELSESHDMVYATVGIHPHDAATLDDASLQKLRELSFRKKVVAIGEIGLDYYRDLSPRPIQRTAFERQIQLAIDRKLPIVIHTRESFDDTYAIVKGYAKDLVGGVFHCFPGTADDAFRVSDLGFVISVGGVITYNKSSMAAMAAEVPLEKIILETDAPYLTPVPFRGKTNKPSYVRYVCAKLAELQNRSEQEVERVTDANAKRLYRLSETFEG
ncbi:MAG: TatD family hydrolase [candidate division Zixibacteria bacterium]|nr:TatD family hydrolase [candidate division Zixibacteria bacterium]